MQHQIAAAAEIGQQEEKVLVNMMEADEINAAIEQDAKVQQGVVSECSAARARLVVADRGAIPAPPATVRTSWTRMGRCSPS